MANWCTVGWLLTHNHLSTEQPIDPYNHEGTLQIWHASKEQNSMYSNWYLFLWLTLCTTGTILHGHCLIKDQSEMPTCRKCYTVNSISFDPNQYASLFHMPRSYSYIWALNRSQIMASAGSNGSVQLWLDGKKLVNGHCQCDLIFLSHECFYFI